MAKGAKILAEATTFPDHLQALLLLHQCNITWQEAREKKFVHFVQALHESQQSQTPLKIIVNALIQKWTAEKREQRQA